MEKFNYEINGYNREEVNSFVDEVTNNTREIVEKCVFYQEEIEKLIDVARIRNACRAKNIIKVVQAI